MNRYIKINLITVITLCLTSCLDRAGGPILICLPPQVILYDAEAFSDDVNVTLSGKYEKEYSNTVIEYGFYYGTNPELESAAKVEAKSKTSIFSVKIPFTDYGMTYYYAAYISNGKSEVLTSAKSFQVPEFCSFVKIGAPSLLQSVDDVSFTYTYDLQIAKGLYVTETGIIYSSNKDEVISQGVRVPAVLDEDINVQIKGLSSGSQYYMCSYVTDGENIAYSDIVKFSHLKPILPPTSPTDVTTSSATTGGI